jgi:CRP-like cAMP-binding protein
MKPKIEPNPGRILSACQGLGNFIEILASKGRFEPRFYRAGEVVVPQGDEETRTFIVKEGWGCVGRCLRDGQRQLIELSLTGDVVDFSSTATSGQEEFSTLTDMVVWEGSSAALAMLAGVDPDVGRFLAAANRRRRAILVERLADIAMRDASTRIAHFLLEIGARLCFAGSPARHGYACPLIQQDLADALGMTPIHVNRMLREARSLGLYEFRRGRVEFLDYAATAAFADFDKDFLAEPVVAKARGRGSYIGAARP